MLCHHFAAALEDPLHDADLGKGGMEDRLMPMLQVPPLHVTGVIQGKGKSQYSLAPVPSLELPERC